MEAEAGGEGPKKVSYPPWKMYRPIKENVYTHREPRNIPPPICDCIPPVKHRPCCQDDRCVNFAMNVECPKTCRGKKGCKNRRFQTQTPPPADVVEAGEKGWGLVLQKNAREGEFLMEYVGEVITKKEMLERKEKYSRRDKSKKRRNKAYFMHLNSGEYLDARKMGGISRFINHSCNPNCYIQKWKVNGENRIGVFAKKDIVKGTELSFDYGWKLLSHLAPSTKCLCGTENCKGTIELVPQKPAIVHTQPQAFSNLKGQWRSPTSKEIGSGQDLVGRRIKVFWTANMEYFQAEVISYDEEADTHTVFYIDHTQDVLVLSQHKWEILDEEKSDFKIGKKKSSRHPNALPLTEERATETAENTHLHKAAEVDAGKDRTSVPRKRGADELDIPVEQQQFEAPRVKALRVKVPRVKVPFSEAKPARMEELRPPEEDRAPKQERAEVIDDKAQPPKKRFCPPPTDPVEEQTPAFVPLEAEKQQTPALPLPSVKVDLDMQRDPECNETSENPEPLPKSLQSPITEDDAHNNIANAQRPTPAECAGNEGSSEKNKGHLTTMVPISPPHCPVAAQYGETQSHFVEKEDHPRMYDEPETTFTEDNPEGNENTDSELHVPLQQSKSHDHDHGQAMKPKELHVPIQQSKPQEYDHGQAMKPKEMLVPILQSKPQEYDHGQAMKPKELHVPLQQSKPQEYDHDKEMKPKAQGETASFGEHEQASTHPRQTHPSINTASATAKEKMQDTSKTMGEGKPIKGVPTRHTDNTELQTRRDYSSTQQKKEKNEESQKIQRRESQPFPETYKEAPQTEVPPKGFIDYSSHQLQDHQARDTRSIHPRHSRSGYKEHREHVDQLYDPGTRESTEHLHSKGIEGRGPPKYHQQWKEPGVSKLRGPPQPSHDRKEEERRRPEERAEGSHQNWREQHFPREPSVSRHPEDNARRHYPQREERLRQSPLRNTATSRERGPSAHEEGGGRYHPRERVEYESHKEHWRESDFQRAREGDRGRYETSGVRHRSRSRDRGHNHHSHSSHWRESEFSGPKGSARGYDEEGRGNFREVEKMDHKDHWRESDYPEHRGPWQSNDGQRHQDQKWGKNYSAKSHAPHNEPIKRSRSPPTRIRYDWKEDSREMAVESHKQHIRRTVSDCNARSMPEYKGEHQHYDPRKEGPVPSPRPRQNLPKHLVKCIFFLQDSCRNGRNCAYMHEDTNPHQPNEPDWQEAPRSKERPMIREPRMSPPRNLQRSRSGPPAPPPPPPPGRPPPTYREDRDWGQDWHREHREHRESRDPREPREPRDLREPREHRDRGRSREREPAKLPPRNYSEHDGHPPKSSYNRVPLDHDPPGPSQPDYHGVERSLPERRPPPPIPPEAQRRRRLALPENKREHASSDVVMEVTMLVPTSTVRHLIGRSGRCVLIMREKSGANIQILSKDNEVPPPAETEVVIKGKQRQILHAKSIIRENIQKALDYIKQGRGSNEGIVKPGPPAVSVRPAPPQPPMPPPQASPVPIPAENEGYGGSHYNEDGGSAKRSRPAAKGRRRRQRAVMGIDWYSFPSPDEDSLAHSQKIFAAKKLAIRLMKDTARELTLPVSVVLHGSVILHRYCAVRHMDETANILDAGLACFHLANKSQKLQSSRRLGKVLFTSLVLQSRRSELPPPEEAQDSPQMVELKARVLAEEVAVLQYSQYDLSFPDACILLRLMTSENYLLQSMMPRFEMFLSLACLSSLWLHFQPKCMLAAVIVVAAGQTMCTRADEDEDELDRDLMGAVHSQVIQGLIFSWDNIKEAACKLGKDVVQIHGLKKAGPLDMDWVMKKWTAFLQEDGALQMAGNRGALVSRLGSAQIERNSLAQLAPPDLSGEDKELAPQVPSGVVLTEQLTLEKRLSPHLSIASVDIDLLENLCEGLPRYLQQADPMEATLPHEDRVRVYLLRWPSERAGGHDEAGAGPDPCQDGFSPLALQESAMFQYLHGLCANPLWGAPVVTPVAPVLGTKIRREHKSICERSKDLKETGTGIISQDMGNSSDSEVINIQKDFEKENYFVIEPSPHILQNLIRYARVSPLPRRLVRHLLRGLLDAVRFCHDRNVVLRAIDTERVFINGQGAVKVAGLGAAVCVLTTSLMSKHQLVSSTGSSSNETLNRKLLVHKAPELLLGKKNYTVATDIWAVGSIACQLALGHPIIQAKNFHQHVEYVFRTCGSPSDDNWPEGKQLPLYKAHKPPQSYKPRVEKQIRQLLEQQASPPEPDDDQLVSFLASMLQLDPAHRPSAKEAFKHDFLQRSPGDDMQPEEVILWMNENLEIESGRSHPQQISQLVNCHNQIPFDGTGNEKRHHAPKLPSTTYAQQKQQSNTNPCKVLPPKIPAPPPPPGASVVP